MKKKITAGILAVSLLLLFLFAEVPFTAENDLNALISDVATYLVSNVPEPTYGSVGGEWLVFGLKRSEKPIDDSYFEKYYQNVEAYVKSQNGVLSERRYTDYARVSIALTALSKDPRDVAGYNLLEPLGDFNKTVKQGINGAIFALIALDSGNYEMPVAEGAETQATREMYIDFILNGEISGGGWAFFGDTPDADITAMALQALSNYQSDTRVKDATNRALLKLSEMQTANGGYAYGSEENAESAAQVIVALSSLNIPVTDVRFVKNGHTLIDNLRTYYVNGSGFKHVLDGEVNEMATEQCFYALVATQRFNDGKSALYHITDVQTGHNNLASTVKKLNIISKGKTFTDIINHKNKKPIEVLAERGIISGKSETEFAPDANVTRAEFAAILVRALGVEKLNGNAFSDVHKSDWFIKDVNTAYRYGIVKGVSKTEFNPNGFVTREEAAVQIYRVLSALNMKSAESKTAVDNLNCSPWASEAISYLMQNDILPKDASSVRAHDAATRGEIADMLYRTLKYANLL